MIRFVPVVCFLAVSLVGCKRAATANVSTPPPQPLVQAARAVQKIEACSLITKEEVGAVQGTTIIGTKSSEDSGWVYLVTQCYYASTGPNLSVSLAVTQFDPKNPTGPSPREQWEQTFGRFRKEETETKRKEGEEKSARNTRGGREEGEERTPPKRIDGVGEEAFWTGNRFGGALYFLKGDVFIRISVGGPDNEEKKIEKSKSLAEKALSRLP